MKAQGMQQVMQNLESGGRLWLWLNLGSLSVAVLVVILFVSLSQARSGVRGIPYVQLAILLTWAGIVSAVLHLLIPAMQAAAARVLFDKGLLICALQPDPLEQLPSLASTSAASRRQAAAPRLASASPPAEALYTRLEALCHLFPSVAADYGTPVNPRWYVWLSRLEFPVCFAAIAAFVGASILWSDSWSNQFLWILAPMWLVQATTWTVAASWSEAVRRAIISGGEFRAASEEPSSTDVRGSAGIQP
jgi:hypothetical protein